MEASTLNETSIQTNNTVISEDKGNGYSQETVQMLSNGVVNLYKPSLSKVKEQLRELTTKQSVLIEQLHNENLKLSWSQNSRDFQDMFNMIKVYHEKLLNIKKDMRSLHERSTKLKKRTLRLQQHQEKERYLKNQQVKHEQDLVPKSNTNGSQAGVQ